MTTRKRGARRSSMKRKDASICEDALYIPNSRILVGREGIEVVLVETVFSLDYEATAPSFPALKFPSPLLSHAPNRFHSMATMEETLENRVDKVIQEQVDDGMPLLHQFIQRRQRHRVTFHESVLQRERKRELDERESSGLSWNMDEDTTTAEQPVVYPSLVDATSTLSEPSPRNMAILKRSVGDRIDRIIRDLANAEQIHETREELSRVEFSDPSRAMRQGNTEDVSSEPLPIDDLNSVLHDESAMALRFVQEVGAFNQTHRSFSWQKNCDEQPWKSAYSFRQEDDSGSSFTGPQLGSTDRYKKQTWDVDGLAKPQHDETGSVFSFLEAPELPKIEAFRVVEQCFGLPRDVPHTASLQQNRRGDYEVHARVMGNLSEEWSVGEKTKANPGYLSSQLSTFGLAIPSKGFDADADREAHHLDGNNQVESRDGGECTYISSRSGKSLRRRESERTNLSNGSLSSRLSPVQSSVQTSGQQLLSIFEIDSVRPKHEVSEHSSSQFGAATTLPHDGDGSPKGERTFSLNAQSEKGSVSSVDTKASEPTWSIDAPPEIKDKLKQVFDVLQSEIPAKSPTDSKSNIRTRPIRGKQFEKSNIPIKDTVTTETTATMSGLLSESTSFHDDSDLDQQLFNAAEAGDYREVQRIQQKGGNILSTHGPTKETALIAACRCGHFFTVRVLLDGGADLEMGDCDDARPLDWASGAGRVDIVRLLLSKGAGFGARADGSTPLHWATAGAHPKVIKILLDAGVQFSSSVIGELPVLCTLEEEELDLARFVALTCSEECCSDGNGKKDSSLLRMACALARYVEAAKQISYRGSSAFVGNEDSGVTSLDIAYIDCGLVLLDYLLQRYEANVLKPGHDQHTLAHSEEYLLLQSLRASFRNTRTEAQPKSADGAVDAPAFSSLKCIDFRYALCLPDDSSIAERQCENVQRDGGSFDDASEVDRLVLEHLCDSSSKTHWYSTFPSCT